MAHIYDEAVHLAGATVWDPPLMGPGDLDVQLALPLASSHDDLLYQMDPLVTPTMCTQFDFPSDPKAWADTAVLGTLEHSEVSSAFEQDFGHLDWRLPPTTSWAPTATVKPVSMTFASEAFTSYATASETISAVFELVEPVAPTELDEYVAVTSPTHMSETESSQLDDAALVRYLESLAPNELMGALGCHTEPPAASSSRVTTSASAQPTRQVIIPAAILSPAKQAVKRPAPQPARRQEVTSYDSDTDSDPTWSPCSSDTSPPVTSRARVTPLKRPERPVESRGSTRISSRKREQNKRAAARYREKKRSANEHLDVRIDAAERVNRDLVRELDSASTELNTLKRAWRQLTRRDPDEVVKQLRAHSFTSQSSHS